MEEKENNIEKLKERFDRFRERYELPEFLELNKIFDIEEIDCETDFLLRKVRRIISDRIAGYLRFVEIILNPSNAPMFFFKLIKKLDEEDKKHLTEIQQILGEFEVEVLKLDLDYNEEKEVEFIKKAYHLFTKEISKKLLFIVKKMGNGENREEKKEKGSYFG
tara:strand:- start:387 stop:875 length:489 start_codon:yes stop_codon:yes gene_type:complete